MRSAVRISVVIPLYNKAAYVEEALASVLLQTSPAYEIIVVDDGSTDDGPARIEALAEPRIRLIRQSNAGVSVARNRGIEAANGDWICFLDADDRYRPGFLARITALVNDFPGAVLLGCGYQRLWPDGRTLPMSVARQVQQRGVVQDFYRAWGTSSFFCTITVAIFSRILKEAPSCFVPGERLGEDQDLWFRMAERGQVAFDPVVEADYRMGVAGSATLGISVLSPLPCYERLAQRIASGEVPYVIQRSARRLLASHYLNVSRARALAGDWRGAWVLWRDSRSAANPIYRWRTAAYLLGLKIRVTKAEI